MRKILLTSACTLVLSLFGAFGANQNSTNLNQLVNANSNTTQVVQNVTNTDNNQSTVGDNQTTTANAVAYAATRTQYTGTNTIQKAIVYKNINLSQCKSVNDVVSILQKNGYTNITKSNIKNIKSLKKVLTAVKVNACANNRAATTAPTKVPVSTVTQTPAPTKTPVVTTAPTKTPIATTTPTKAPSVTNAPAATVAPSNTSSISSYASEVLRLVNVERAKAGLSAYTTNQTLSSAANKRAQETSVSFSHTRPDGSSFSSVLKEFGISYMAAGENIAYGQRTPQEVVTGWMNSPGHRANILNANFHKIGIGVYQKNGVIYWTQEFTN